MATSIDPWAVFFIIGITIGLLLVTLFIFFFKRYSIHVQNVTILLAVLVAILFSELIEKLLIAERFSFFQTHSIVFDLLVWPFLLFYIQYVVGSRNRYQLIDCVWFIPFIIGWYWNWLLIQSNVASNESDGITSSVAFFVAYKFTVSIGFLIILLLLLKKKKDIMSHLLIHLKRVTPFQGIYYFHVVLLLSISIIYILFFMNYFQIFRFPDSDDIGSLVISSILFSFSVVVFYNPLVIDPTNYSASIKNFFEGNELSHAKKLLKLMNEHPYLNSEITPDDFAQKMQLSIQQFSYLLNRYLGVSFTDFINSYRVEAMKQALQNQEKNGNLLQIGFSCGFNSKSSMNRIFKKHTGESPSEFMKKEASFLK